MNQQYFDKSARFVGGHDSTRLAMRDRLPNWWDVLYKVEIMAFHLVSPPLVMIERTIIEAL